MHDGRGRACWRACVDAAHTANCLHTCRIQSNILWAVLAASFIGPFTVAAFFAFGSVILLKKTARCPRDRIDSRNASTMVARCWLAVHCTADAFGSITAAHGVAPQCRGMQYLLVHKQAGHTDAGVQVSESGLTYSYGALHWSALWMAVVVLQVQLWANASSFSPHMPCCGT